MIKIGDTVTLKKDSYFYKKGERWTGIVRDISLWEDDGPLSPENHGLIEIELLTVEKYYLEPGELEHFTFWGWEKDLEILDNGKGEE